MITLEPSQPVVSVLMPVRNEEKFVVAAIESVLEQEVPLELLVIDGASTDHTASLVAGFRDARVRLLSNPARTIPSALNIGLAQAHGSFVGRVDAHARVNREYLHLGLRQLDDPEVAAVGGIRIGVATTPTGRAIAAALSSPFGVGNSINHFADTVQDTDHASFGLYRTAVAKTIGGWDETLLANEDVDFDLRLLQAGHRIRFDPAMKIYWQVREELSSFARQYRRYGRGKAGMVRKNGWAAVGLRHLAAPALVALLGAAGITAAAGHRARGAGLATPYLVAVTVATARTFIGSDPELRPRPLALAAAFMTMHVSWGVGFLEGLVFRRRPAAGSGVDPGPAHRST